MAVYGVIGSDSYNYISFLLEKHKLCLVVSYNDETFRLNHLFSRAYLPYH